MTENSGPLEFVKRMRDQLPILFGSDILQACVIIETLDRRVKQKDAEIAKLKAAYQRASDNAIVVDDRNSIEPGDPDWPPSNSPPQAGDAYNDRSL